MKPPKPLLISASAFDLPLADESVHCAVTSPPYWALRNYDGEQGEAPLGLEPTPELHIERIVRACAEVKRVLRPDGVFWFNYGDCYAGSGGEHQDGGGQSGLGIENRGERVGHVSNKVKSYNVPAGNLMMLPARIALALQADGWIVRRDVIWHKTNPMPESPNGWRWEREREEVGREKGANKQMTSGAYKHGRNTIQGGTDKVEWEYGDGWRFRRGSWRQTTSHEYVFMLVKEMGYWGNRAALREVLGRNPRSVLSAPTSNDGSGHFATFPPELIAPLIQATCPRWTCPECGQGWAPVIEKGETTFNIAARDTVKGRGDKKAHHLSWGEQRPEVLASYDANNETVGKVRVVGHRPACEHPHSIEEARPGVVFDPFAGSGTTPMTAAELLRQGVGTDISWPYLNKIARRRTRIGGGKQVDDLPLFGGGLDDG